MVEEEYYIRNLEIILVEMKKNDVKGASFLQWICRIGYNQAVRTIEYGIKKGCLIRDKDSGWLFRLAD